MTARVWDWLGKRFDVAQPRHGTETPWAPLGPAPGRWASTEGATPRMLLRQGAAQDLVDTDLSDTPDNRAVATGVRRALENLPKQHLAWIQASTMPYAHDANRPQTQSYNEDPPKVLALGSIEVTEEAPYELRVGAAAHYAYAPSYISGTIRLSTATLAQLAEVHRARDGKEAPEGLDTLAHDVLLHEMGHALDAARYMRVHGSGRMPEEWKTTDTAFLSHLDASFHLAQFGDIDPMRERAKLSADLARSRIYFRAYHEPVERFADSYAYLMGSGRIRGLPAEHFATLFPNTVAQVAGLLGRMKLPILRQPPEPPPRFDWQVEVTAALEKFNPEQPREPKGTPEGGQWAALGQKAINALGREVVGQVVNHGESLAVAGTRARVEALAGHPVSPKDHAKILRAAGRTMRDVLTPELLKGERSVELFQTGVNADPQSPYWYANGKENLNRVFGEDADLFRVLLAASSPNASVPANLTMALGIYARLKANGMKVPPKGRRFPNVTRQVTDTIRAYINGGRSLDALRAVGGEGLKVYNFVRAMTGDEDAVVLDRWMLRAMGAKVEALGGESQYEFFADILRHRAKLVGVTPAQFQAGMWKGAQVFAAKKQTLQDSRAYQTQLVERARRGSLIPKTAKATLAMLGAEEQRILAELQRHLAKATVPAEVWRLSALVMLRVGPDAWAAEMATLVPGPLPPFRPVLRMAALLAALVLAPDPDADVAKKFNEEQLRHGTEIPWAPTGPAPGRWADQDGGSPGEVLQSGTFSEPLTEAGAAALLATWSTPEVETAALKTALVRQTWEDQSPERQAVRAAVAEALAREGETRAARKYRIDLVIGGPGSGKSSAVANFIAKRNKSTIADTDIAADRLPEAKAIGRSARPALQDEASHILEEQVLPRLLRQGVNLVIPMVGRTQGKIEALIDRGNALGYEVHLHYVDVPVAEQVNRAMTRYRMGDRFTPPSYIISVVGDKPRKTYEALKQDPRLASARAYSNLVPFGRPPLAIETILGRGRHRATGRAVGRRRARGYGPRRSAAYLALAKRALPELSAEGAVRRDAWTASYRRALEALDPTALDRVFRDQRGDERLMRSALGVDDAGYSNAQLERMVGTYRRRAEEYLRGVEAMRAWRIADSTALRAGWDWFIIGTGTNPNRLKKTWITMGDHRVRDEHAEMHGVVLPYPASFVVDGEEVWGPPHSYGCRCTLKIEAEDGALPPEWEITEEGLDAAAEGLMVEMPARFREEAGEDAERLSVDIGPPRGQPKAWWEPLFGSRASRRDALGAARQFFGNLLQEILPRRTPEPLPEADADEGGGGALGAFIAPRPPTPAPAARRRRPRPPAAPAPPAPPATAVTPPPAPPPPRLTEEEMRRAIEEALGQTFGITKRFNEAQPRVPKGSPDGGQWTDLGGASSAVPMPLPGGGWDTPEWKAWFKGSAVTYLDGSPRVVYHGTRRGFSRFNIGSKDPVGYLSRHLGAHFALDPSVTDAFTVGEYARADRYMHGEKIPLRGDTGLADLGNEGKGTWDSAFIQAGGRVLPVYLSLKNPKVIPQTAFNEYTGKDYVITDDTAVGADIAATVWEHHPALFVQWAQRERKLPEPQARRLYHYLKDGSTAGLPTKRPEWGAPERDLWDIIERHKPGAGFRRFAQDLGMSAVWSTDPAVHRWANAMLGQYKAILRAQGHDGVIYQNTSGNEVKGHASPMTYIAFRPQQVKSIFNPRPGRSKKIHKKYNAEQPREPKGAPGGIGGQWAAVRIHALSVAHGQWGAEVAAARGTVPVLPPVTSGWILTSGKSVPVARTGFADHGTTVSDVVPRRDPKGGVLNPTVTFLSAGHIRATVGATTLNLDLARPPTRPQEQAIRDILEVSLGEDGIERVFISIGDARKHNETMRDVVMEYPRVGAVLARIRREYEALDVTKAYNAEQPRAPKGTPEGGQWVESGIEASAEMADMARLYGGAGAPGSAHAGWVETGQGDPPSWLSHRTKAVLKDATPNRRRFLDATLGKATMNPFDPNESILSVGGKHAAVTFTALSGDSGYPPHTVHWDWVRALTPGGGGAAARSITALADRHGITLVGTAKAVPRAAGRGVKALSQRKLLAWYRDLGFVQEPYLEGEGLSDIVIRQPRVAKKYDAEQPRHGTETPWAPTGPAPGRWAGEGGEGASVAQSPATAETGGRWTPEGIPAMLPKRMVQAIKGGGFTFSNRTGQTVADGYAVAPWPERTAKFDRLTKRGAAKFLWDNARLLRHEGIVVGGWKDDNGTVWLDLVKVYPRSQRDIALAVGRKRNQVSIADLGAIAKGDWDHAILPTGGTGEALGKAVRRATFILFPPTVTAAELVAAFGPSSPEV